MQGRTAHGLCSMVAKWDLTLSFSALCSVAYVLQLQFSDLAKRNILERDVRTCCVFIFVENLVRGRSRHYT
jgi:hypothetical protein